LRLNGEIVEIISLLCITAKQREIIHWHKLLWNTGFTKLYVGLMVLVKKKMSVLN